MKALSKLWSIAQTKRLWFSRVFGLLFFGVLFWPSCGPVCPDAPPYIHIKSVQVIGFKNYDFILQPTDITEDDAFRITAQFDDVDYVTETVSWNWGNSAYALSCVDPGENGLKSAIDSIWITSDQDFRGIVKGESINSVFQAQHEVYNEDSLKYILEPISFAQQAADANKSQNIVGDMFWVPNTHKETQVYQMFQINILFEDGRKLTRSTNPVKFIE